MAALPYQCSPFAALRYKAPIRAWRSATCVALAITSLMAAAITWTPVTAAAPCAGTSSSPAANCQPQTASSGLFSSAKGGVFGSDDVHYIAHVNAASAGKTQAVKKTVRVNTTSSSTGGAGSGGGSNLPAATGGLPCQQSYMFVSHISQWTTPPGCYATIYYPDRSIYHAPGNFGFCNWWVLALHPNQQDILYGKEYTRTKIGRASCRERV